VVVVDGDSVRLDASSGKRRTRSAAIKAASVSEDGSPRVGIDLLWIPLGAGGSGWVRVNGRAHERITALVERRPPVDLYHTAVWV
jgi:hypothetical protein